MLTRVDGRRDEDAKGGVSTGNASENHRSASGRPIQMTKMKSTGAETVVEVGNVLEEGGMIGAWWLSEMGRPAIWQWP